MLYSADRVDKVKYLCYNILVALAYSYYSILVSRPEVSMSTNDPSPANGVLSELASTVREAAKDLPPILRFILAFTILIVLTVLLQAVIPPEIMPHGFAASAKSSKSMPRSARCSMTSCRASKKPAQ